MSAATLLDLPLNVTAQAMTSDGSVLLNRDAGGAEDLYAIDLTGDNLTELAASEDDGILLGTTLSSGAIYERTASGQLDVYSVGAPVLEINTLAGRTGLQDVYSVFLDGSDAVPLGATAACSIRIGFYSE